MPSWTLPNDIPAPAPSDTWYNVLGAILAFICIAGGVAFCSAMVLIAIGWY